MSDQAMNTRVIHGDYTSSDDLIHHGHVLVRGNVTGIGRIHALTGSVTITGDVTGATEIRAEQDVHVSGNVGWAADILSAHGNVIVKGAADHYATLLAPNGTVHTERVWERTLTSKAYAAQHPAARPLSEHVAETKPSAAVEPFKTAQAEEAAALLHRARVTQYPSAQTADDATHGLTVKSAAKKVRQV